MKKKKFNASTIKKVLNAIKKYRLLLLISIILATVTVALSLYIPIVIGNAIDLIIDTGNVDFDSIKPMLLKVGIIAIITAFLQWIMNNINNKRVVHTVTFLEIIAGSHLSAARSQEHFPPGVLRPCQ
jgi:ATP-binding cassette subfamily B protein